MAQGRKVCQRQHGHANDWLLLYATATNHTLPLLLPTYCNVQSMHAFRYSVSKAEQRLRAHAVWRQEYVPLGRIHEVRQA